MSETAPRRGGRREGAGRPRIMVDRVRQNVYLDQRHMHLIANWQAEHGGSFSEALRDILDRVGRHIDG